MSSSQIIPGIMAKKIPHVARDSLVLLDGTVIIEKLMIDQLDEFCMLLTTTYWISRLLNERMSIFKKMIKVFIAQDTLP